jgi:hypothetical protein
MVFDINTITYITSQLHFEDLQKEVFPDPLKQQEPDTQVLASPRILPYGKPNFGSITNNKQKAFKA